MFSVLFWLESDEICKNNNQTYLSHLPGSGRDVQNSLLGKRQMLMHEKICVLPIVSHQNNSVQIL